MRVVTNADRWIRWIARGVGLLVVACWAVVSAAELIWSHAPFFPEEAILAGLALVAVLGVIIAWRWEGVGGLIAVVGGIALAIFAYVTAGHNKGFAMLVSGGPFLVVAILFLVSWWRSR